MENLVHLVHLIIDVIHIIKQWKNNKEYSEQILNSTINGDIDDKVCWDWGVDVIEKVKLYTIEEENTLELIIDEYDDGIILDTMGENTLNKMIEDWEEKKESLDDIILKTTDCDVYIYI